eukprot:CFRG8251T1
MAPIAKSTASTSNKLNENLLSNRILIYRGVVMDGDEDRELLVDLGDRCSGELEDEDNGNVGKCLGDLNFSFPVLDADKGMDVLTDDCPDEGPLLSLERPP